MDEISTALAIAKITRVLSALPMAKHEAVIHLARIEATPVRLAKESQPCGCKQVAPEPTQAPSDPPQGSLL